MVPNFTNTDGSLTEDGRKVIDFIEAQFLEADQRNDVAALNSLGQPYNFFYVNVHKLGMLTPERFAKEHPNGMTNAWNNMQYVEEQAAQAAQVEETAEQTNELSEQLEQLREELAGALKTIKSQERKVKKLETQLAEAQTSAETETEAEDDEPDTEPEDTTDEEA